MTWWSRTRRDWPMLALLAFLAGSGVVGLQGLRGAPSPTVEAVIGGYVYLYSAGMVGAAALAAVGVLAKLRRAEAAGVLLLAVLSLVHGAVVLTDTGPAGDQTGTRIAVSFFSLLSLAGTRWQRGLSLHDLDRVEHLAAQHIDDTRPR